MKKIFWFLVCWFSVFSATAQQYTDAQLIAQINATILGHTLTPHSVGTMLTNMVNSHTVTPITANRLVKSNGTNFVTSGITSSDSTNIAFGDGTTATIAANGELLFTYNHPGGVDFQSATTTNLFGIIPSSGPLSIGLNLFPTFASLEGGGGSTNYFVIRGNHSPTSGVAANDLRLTGGDGLSGGSNGGNLVLLPGTAASGGTDGKVKLLATSTANYVLTAASTDGSIGWGAHAAGLFPTAVKTSNYTAVPLDFVPADASGGNFTVTLPTAPTDGVKIGVKRITTTPSSGSSTVSITCGGSDVFNKTAGSTTLTFTLANQSKIFQYKASSAIWYVTSSDDALGSIGLNVLGTANQEFRVNAGATAWEVFSPTTNPMTTLNDIIVGGTVVSGVATPTRLGIGTERQILSVVSGAAAWQSGIVGTVTNDNAAAGSVGELVPSLVPTGSGVSLTTATQTNITSINLTAGDWDVEGNINFTETTSTVTARVGGVSSTSATLPTDGSEVYNGVQSTVTSEVNSITLPRKRITLSGAATIYLVAKATFSAGTCAGFGTITARRVR